MAEGPPALAETCLPAPSIKEPGARMWRGANRAQSDIKDHPGLLDAYLGACYVVVMGG
jgi:hypothetical protein